MRVIIINGPNLNLLGKRERSIYGDISVNNDELDDFIVAAIDTPVIEVHISNIYAREEFRKRSLLSPNCKAVICGLGLDSYKAGLLTL